MSIPTPTRVFLRQTDYYDNYANHDYHENTFQIINAFSFQIINHIQNTISFCFDNPGLLQLL